MELGSRIKQLRNKSGYTQEQLAEKLGVSAQSVSKWENAAAMPDITLLPFIAGEFGVSIDDLFDLTKEQKLHRIQSRMDTESELPGDLFWEYEEFLRSELNDTDDRGRILSLLAHLYHHRMTSDARKVSRYAREAITLAPEKKDCQWLLQMAEGEYIWDWNVGNHSRTIDFYREVIENDRTEPPTPLPYYYLIDDLLADNRTKEAAHYVEEVQKCPAHKPVLIQVYKANIALADYDEKKADAIIEEGLKQFPDNNDMLFEAAQYYARKCDYERAIELYGMAYETEQKPRFYDALQGIARIQEIQGKFGEAAATYDRILDNLRDEWGYTEEYAVKEAEAERNRLLRKK